MFAETSVTEDSGLKRGCLKLMRAMGTSAALITILSVAGLLKRPYSPHLPTSIWISTAPSHFQLELVLIAIFATYFWTCQWLCLLYCASMEAAIPTAVVNTLEVLR